MQGEVLPFSSKASAAAPLDDFDEYFENAAIALHLVGRDGTILRANRAELEMLGYSSDEYIGKNITEFHADQAAIADILARLKRGEKLDKYPAKLKSKHGGLRDVLITSSVRFQKGEFVHTRCFTLDVTDLKRAQDALAQREAHTRQLLDALPAAIYTTDAKGVVTYFNRAAVEFSGRVPVTGEDLWCVTWRLHTPDGKPLPHAECPMAVALQERRPVRNQEAIAERPDGSRVAFMPYPTPLIGNNGELSGAVNMLVDLTEQKKHEQKQRLLVRELHHRVKNTLATVQAIMSTTMRFSTSMEEFQSSFVSRIGALAKTHSILTEDEDQVIDFKILLMNELEAFGGGKGKVTLDGGTALLPAHLAVPIGMAIHELTTNAAKYGALSRVGATLRVTWTMRGEALTVIWEESGLTSVKKPQHLGFGHQLLNRVLPQQIGASVQLNYEPDGLKGRFAVPIGQQPL